MAGRKKIVRLKEGSACEECPLRENTLYHHIHGVSKFKIDFFYCRPPKSRVLNGCRGFIYFFRGQKYF
jgi:hypothetical protein